MASNSKPVAELRIGAVKTMSAASPRTTSPFRASTVMVTSGRPRRALASTTSSCSSSLPTRHTGLLPVQRRGGQRGRQ